MAYKYLVIVESPTKAKTIEKYLGRNYKVVASKGHLRDLPKSRMAVDIENDYQPDYISIRGKGDLIKELKKYGHKAEKIYLASDPDREGGPSHGILHICWAWTQQTISVSFIMK